MVVTARPLKVCHVFASTEGGRWVYEQLEALERDHGCEVCVVLPEGSGSTVELFQRAGIRIKRFDFRIWGLTALLTLPFRIIGLARWMRRERLDVVQSHIIMSTFFARPAAWLADIPVRLVMVTSPYYMQAPSIRWMEKMTAQMETGVIPSCALTADLYAEAGTPARLIQPILYYGPHEHRFDPARTRPEGLRAEFGLAAKTPLIGSIAIFYPRCGGGSIVPPETRNKFIKGHTDLIEAMAFILPEFPQARLVMIGKGWGPSGPQAEQELHDFVRQKGLGDHVLFAGWRASTAAVYMDLDVSVQASVNENLGGTVESLLMARPTVATRIGGMVDAVIDGETGILVRPSDPADLARGILELLRDPDRAAALGKAGRERMLAGFTLSTTVPALASLYRRQLQEAPGAWRLGKGASRLLLATIIGFPIFMRAALIDLFLLNLLPAKIGSAGRWLRSRSMPRSTGVAHDTGGGAA
jgi:glycosyltransferase involved in cell wall biosynthesis